MHVFQDLALEDECLTMGPTVLAALAWAPDDVEVRREMARLRVLGEAMGEPPESSSLHRVDGWGLQHLFFFRLAGCD